MINIIFLFLLDLESCLKVFTSNCSTQFILQITVVVQKKNFFCYLHFNRISFTNLCRVANNCSENFIMEIKIGCNTYEVKTNKNSSDKNI